MDLDKGMYLPYNSCLGFWMCHQTLNTLKAEASSKNLNASTMSKIFLQLNK